MDSYLHYKDDKITSPIVYKETSLPACQRLCLGVHDVQCSSIVYRRHFRECHISPYHHLSAHRVVLTKEVDSVYLQRKRCPGRCNSKDSDNIKYFSMLLVVVITEREVSEVTWKYSPNTKSKNKFVYYQYRLFWYFFLPHQSKIYFPYN